jgi:hypothetical protein
MHRVIFRFWENRLFATAPHAESKNIRRSRMAKNRKYESRLPIALWSPTSQL